MLGSDLTKGLNISGLVETFEIQFKNLTFSKYLARAMSIS